MGSLRGISDLESDLGEEWSDCLLKAIHGANYVILNSSPLIFGGAVSPLLAEKTDAAGSFTFEAFPDQ